MNSTARPSNSIQFHNITHQLERPTLLLETRSGNHIGCIDYTNFKMSLIGNGIDELSFDVHKYVDGRKCEFWDRLTDFTIINFKGYGRFEADFTVNEQDETIKTCVAVSLESELGQRILREFHVNDDEAITNSISIDLENGSYQPIVLYDKEHPNHSLLHRVILDKAPHWSIGEVSELFHVNDMVYEPESFQRTYTADGTSIYDFLTGDVATETHCIFTFDTYNRKINCYNLEDCVYEKSTCKVVEGAYKSNGILYHADGSQLNPADYGYCEGIGSDTNILITRNRLAQNFQLNTDKDSVKNCFYVTGGDDVMTHTVAAANTTGNNYIYLFDNFQYQDMSDKLTAKLQGYNTFLSGKKSSFYADGGIYIYDAQKNYTYDSDTQTCRDDSNRILKDAICQNNKVYVLDTCAYYENNGENKVFYSKDGDLLAEGTYIYKEAGIYTQYCHAKDRYYYLNDSQFPNVTIAETTAQKQLDRITGYFANQTNQVIIKSDCTSTSFATATNTVESMLEVVCDSRYKIDILNDSEHPQSCSNISSTQPTGTWTGYIKLTRETQEKDSVISTAPISIPIRKITTDDWDTDSAYCQQRMQIAIAKMSIADLDFTNRTTQSQLEDFFDQYNLTSLISFRDAFQSCIDTLNQLYSSMDTATSSSYNEARTTYDVRLAACKNIVTKRQRQVNEVYSKIKVLDSEIIDFRKEVNMQSYFNDDELWKEFQSYIREDEYNNNNYISDGLSDSELLYQAKELLDVATDELKKACKNQKSISGNLYNIFAVDELESLYDSFALFNYIRCKVDDTIYKLRLIQIDFDENSPENLNVTFSDQIEDVDSTINDLQSIIQQAGSIATSYDSTANQAKQGATALNTFTTLKSDGLSSADYIIKNSDEEVVIDRTGILCRSMEDMGSYGEHQIKITGNTIVFTDNAWQSAPKMALGYMMLNGEWLYGVCCDALVGNLIAGEKLVISNKNSDGVSTVTIDDNGINIENGYIDIKNGNKRVTLDPFNEKTTGYVFRITDNEGNTTIGMDSEGHAEFNGTIHATDGEFSGTIYSKDGKIGGWNIDESHLYTEGTEINGVKSKVLLDSVNGIVQTSGYNGSVQLGSFLNPNEIRFSDNTNSTSLSQSLYDNNIPVLLSSSNFAVNGTVYANQLHIENDFVLANGTSITSGTVNDSGEKVIYNDGSTFINGNFYVDGTGVVKSPCSNKVYIYWDGSSLQSQVDTTSLGKILTLNDDSSWTDSGNYRTGSGIDGRNLTSVEYVQNKFQEYHPSDFRLKKDISTLSNIKDFYLNLKPKQYQFKDTETKDHEKYYTGLLAQEVQSNLERHGFNSAAFAIVEEYDTRPYMDEGQYVRNGKALRVNYDNLHAYHIAFGQEIYQELTKEIHALKQQLDILKQQIQTNN